jgi:hypothetical protein
MHDENGTIPQSNALAEASPESLNDLMSRNPFEYTLADEVRVIEELRKLRQRVMDAQAGGKGKPKGKAPVRLGTPEQAKESLGDLGL